VRAVLDPNILIASLLSPRGTTPARALASWLAGEFELIVSEGLLAELGRALAYPKLRERIAEEDARAFQELLRGAAVVASDPVGGSYHSSDRDDDYLLALAETERAVLVTGGGHLLVLADELPVVTARTFVESLAADIR
jgi:putative PIN family toxin of toxin-antitoxin system